MIPEIVFIVPYRDRESHKQVFLKEMTSYLSKYEYNYEIYFSHQCDNRPFNRGAIKNIGFLAIKNKYPNDYKNITFVFHDVDTLPTEKANIDYKTTLGVVSHYYGEIWALGGLFSIKGEDFEKIEGFPNFWGWGLEDNTIYDRCVKHNIQVDRSVFYPMNDVYKEDASILRLNDGFIRICSIRDPTVYKFETPDTLFDISNLKYSIEDQYINISGFDVVMDPNEQVYREANMLVERKIPIAKNCFRKVWKMF